MPRSGSDSSSASREKCGCRRDPGYLRTSSRRLTPAAARMTTNSSSERAPCPIENTVGCASVGDCPSKPKPPFTLLLRSRYEKLQRNPVRILEVEVMSKGAFDDA